MRLDIWGTLANGGQASATNTQIANYLLTTVNKAAPDAATLAAAVNAINTETGAAQGNFLSTLAAHTANQTQVGLIGLATKGLEFGGPGWRAGGLVGWWAGFKAQSAPAKVMCYYIHSKLFNQDVGKVSI